MRCTWVNVGVACLIGLACGRRSPQPAPAPAATHGDVVLSAGSSAYHASIIGDGDVFYLLTSAAAYRLEPGHAPVEMPLDLGFGATTTRSSLVYWSRGAVFQAPKTPPVSTPGVAPRRLVALPERPQLFVAAGEAVAWLARAGDGRFSLEAAAGAGTRTLYMTAGNIDAVTALGDSIFFVERPAGSDWRIGRVPIAGGAPAFSPLRPGRAPAMLAGRRDLVFYDGNRLEVRRLSADLQGEETLAGDVICSPITVAERIYCAQVEGIVELQPGAPPRRLAATARLITGIAASDRRLLWVVDAGAERLDLHALALPAPLR
jgi:hypothetical protein